MAELVTIARPYATAVFEHARQKGQLAEWSEMLAFMVSAFQDPSLQAALQNPQYSREEQERLLISVFGEKIDGAARNLVSLLVRNGRLDALLQVRELFEELKAEAERIVDARIESAFPVSDEQVRALVQRLEARTGRKVRPSVDIEPKLIGGVKIQLGDEVWDASVRGQLENLAVTLTR